MRNIDRQRIAAVQTIEHLGNPLAGHKWLQPANDTAAPLDADALFALIIERAAELARCTEGSDEERELEAIADAVEAYEAVRWPNGKTDGGKG